MLSLDGVEHLRGSFQATFERTNNQRRQTLWLLFLQSITIPPHDRIAVLADH